MEVMNFLEPVSKNIARQSATNASCCVAEHTHRSTELCSACAHFLSVALRTRFHTISFEIVFRNKRGSSGWNVLLPKLYWSTVLGTRGVHHVVASVMVAFGMARTAAGVLDPWCWVTHSQLSLSVNSNRRSSHWAVCIPSPRPESVFEDSQRHRPKMHCPIARASLP